MDNIGFFRMRQILKLIPISRSKFWMEVKNGSIPRPLKMGRLSFWKKADIYHFLDQIQLEHQWKSKTKNTKKTQKTEGFDCANNQSLSTRNFK